MIIDKNIDKSLLLVLNAERENRDKIIGFINSIPDELKLLIKDRMKLYEDYKKNGEKNLAYLCGEYNTSDDLLYFFEIDTYFKEIDIGCMKSNGYVYEDVFGLTLSLDDELLLIKNFDKKYVGRIEYDIYTENVDGICSIKSSSENTYNLVKTPLGYVVLCSRDNDKGVKKHYQKIDVSGISEELHMEDIQELNNVNRLVRRKRK